MIHLSLLVAYRDRRRNLDSLLDWFKLRQARRPKHRIELVLVEYAPKPTARRACEGLTDVQYRHVEGSGMFPKSKLLNLALQLSQGRLVAPWDVDLLPVEKTLDRHIDHAWNGRQSLCLTGHRLMCRRARIPAATISREARRASSPHEESAIFLRKQLLEGWRFGVVPLYEPRRLRKAGAWDERFIGWGGEDQDVLERYLGDDLILARSPDLLYLHLHHPPSQRWSNKERTARNRELYYGKTGQRRRIGDRA